MWRKILHVSLGKGLGESLGICQKKRSLGMKIEQIASSKQARFDEDGALARRKKKL